MAEGWVLPWACDRGLCFCVVCPVCFCLCLWSPTVTSAASCIGPWSDCEICICLWIDCATVIFADPWICVSSCLDCDCAVFPSSPFSPKTLRPFLCENVTNTGSYATELKIGDSIKTCLFCVLAGKKRVCFWTVSYFVPPHKASSSPNMSSATF